MLQNLLQSSKPTILTGYRHSAGGLIQFDRIVCEADKIRLSLQPLKAP